jgi:trigger factor
MNSQFEDLSKTTKRITLDIPFQEYKDGFEGIVDEISGSAKLRGFRKGKVPRNLVLDYYEPEIRSRVLQRIVHPEVEKALKDNNIAILSPLRNPKLTYGKEQPINFSAEFDSQASFELPDLSQIRLEVPSILEELVSQDADLAFENYLEAHSAVYKMAPPEHVIAENDRVSFEEAIFHNGKEVKRKKSEQRPHVYTVKKMGDYDIYHDSLLGHKVGDVVEVKHKMPANYKNRAIAGKEVSVRFKIISVLEYTRIPVETYVNELGDQDIKTPEDLRRQFINGIRTKLEDRVDKDKRDMLIDKIAENGEVPIPGPFLQTFYAQIMAACDISESNVRNLMGAFMSEGELPPDIPKFVRDMKKLGLRRAREHQIMQKVISDQGLEVTDGEVDEYLRKIIIKQYPKADEDKIDALRTHTLANPESKEQAQNNILWEKAYQWLLDRVQVVVLSDDETREMLKALELELKQEAEREGNTEEGDGLVP